MNTYDIIYEELQDRVNNGDITLEFAESVNDLAYDKYYFTEMKKKADYRREKFLKQHNYDPKTKTIDLDGQKVRFNFIGGSNKRHVVTNSSIKRYGRRCQDKDGQTYEKSKIKGLQMDNAAFNMKHPKAHEFVAGHEIAGHVENERKNERKTSGFTGKFDDSFSGLPDEAKRIYLEIRRLNKKSENKTLTSEEYEEAKQLAHKLSEIESKRINDHNDKAKFKALKADVDNMIKDMLSKGVKLSRHGMSKYEYIADYAGATRMQDGKKIAKKTLTDLEKRATHPKRQQETKNTMRNNDKQLKRENECILEKKKKNKEKNKELKKTIDMVNKADREVEDAKNNLLKFYDENPKSAKPYSSKTAEKEEYLKNKVDDCIKHADDMHTLRKNTYNDNYMNKITLRFSRKDRNRLEDQINDVVKKSNEEYRNGLALRRKSLDMMDKNPNASFIRDKNKGNRNK